MATWPGTLPQTILDKGYSESPPNTVIRSENGYGPAKLRRRTTGDIRPLRCKIFLTLAQVEILDDFYISDLSYGSIQFTWTHPRTAASKSFRFVEPPSYNNLGNGYFIANLNLEIMPA